MKCNLKKKLINLFLDIYNKKFNHMEASNNCIERFCGPVNQKFFYGSTTVMAPLYRPDSRRTAFARKTHCQRERVSFTKVKVLLLEIPAMNFQKEKKTKRGDKLHLLHSMWKPARRWLLTTTL